MKPVIQVMHHVPQFQSIGSFSKQSSVKISVLPQGDYAPKSIPIKKSKVKIQREDTVQEAKEEESQTRVTKKPSTKDKKQKTKSKKEQLDAIKLTLASPSKEKSKLTIEDSSEEAIGKKKKAQTQLRNLKDCKNLQFEIIKDFQAVDNQDLPLEVLQNDSHALKEPKHSGTITFLNIYKKQKQKPRREKDQIKQQKIEKKQIKLNKEQEKKIQIKEKRKIQRNSSKDSKNSAQVPQIDWDSKNFGANDPFYNFSIALQNSVVHSIDECRSTTQTPQKKKLKQKYLKDQFSFKYLANEDNYQNFFFPNNLFYTRISGIRGRIKGLLNCLSSQILWPAQQYVFYTRNCLDFDIEIVLLPFAEINLTDLLHEVKIYKMETFLVPNTSYTSESEPSFEFICHHDSQIIRAQFQRKQVRNPNRHNVIVKNQTIQRLLRISIEIVKI